MATGVNASEMVGPKALRGARPDRDACPLPPSDAEVTLAYPNKVPESQILRRVDTEYVRLNEDRSFGETSRIMPNALVLADNYYALHTLAQQQTKASLIYTDPPFCTGMDFQSRHLQHAYSDTLSQAAYLEFMRRRLVLMRELLADDGSIYIHIGVQMVSHLKALMDEVFGRRNFRNLISRKKCSSKNFTSKQYANLHDYILFYSRSPNYKWNQPGETPDTEWIAREYPKRDERGQYKLVPIHAPGIRHGETGKPWRGMIPPPGKHWQYTPSTLDDLDKRGEIHWSKNGNPRRKVYLPAEKLVPLTDYWPQFRDAHHQSIKITGYPTEKNLNMLRMIVAASSEPGDLVIDPFCGSGTTLEAAHLGDRAWIGIDESFVAMQTAVDRLRFGTRPMGDYVEKSAGACRNMDQLFRTEEIVTTQGDEARRAAEFELVVDADLVDEHPEEIERLALAYDHRPSSQSRVSR